MQRVSGYSSSSSGSSRSSGYKTASKTSVKSESGSSSGGNSSSNKSYDRVVTELSRMTDGRRAYEQYTIHMDRHGNESTDPSKNEKFIYGTPTKKSILSKAKSLFSFGRR